MCTRLLSTILLVLLAALLVAVGANAAALTPLTPDDSDWASTPIYATSPPKDKRVFVVERAGRIRIVQDGVLQQAAFLVVPSVDTSGERGLLSMAFSPSYATDGLFYVFASTVGSPAQTRILEYHVSSNPNIADPASLRPVISWNLGSATNHNGGQLNFGPDGYLYISVGENGTSSNAQTLANTLGKILRISPYKSGVNPYSVPSDNPFVASGGARTEIWALGLRNPYRTSWDKSGRLTIADVGEGTTEEVDIGTSGANYGWPICEGSCGNAGLAGPVFSYGHQAGVSCAIIGGYVVRDPTLTGLTDQYLFGDNCDRPLRKVKLAVEAAASPAGLTALNDNSLVSFGEDSVGCVYVMADSTAYRVVANAGDSAACPLTFPPDESAGGGSAGAATVKIASKSLREDSKGRVEVKLTCTTTVACRAAVQLRSSKRLRLRRGGKATRFVLGKTNAAAVGPGETKIFQVRLRRGPRHVLHVRNKLRTQIRADLAGVDPVKTVTLREAKQR